MNFIKSLFKVLLTLLFYFIIIAFTNAIMWVNDQLLWDLLWHAIIITQGILIGKIISRHNSNKSTNLAYLGGFGAILALLINNTTEYYDIIGHMGYAPILGTGSILFSIVFAYAFSLENFEHWKMFLLKKKNPIQKKVIDDGIPLGKEMIEKSKPIQSKLKKIISELEFNKPTIIKTALLIMIFDVLICPPYKNTSTLVNQVGDTGVGHHFRFEELAFYINVDYNTLFKEYIIIGIISLGLIYIKSLNDEKNTN